jgi:hypothetical protein
MLKGNRRTRIEWFVPVRANRSQLLLLGDSHVGPGLVRYPRTAHSADGLTSLREELV